MMYRPGMSNRRGGQAKNEKFPEKKKVVNVVC